ncbi:anthranilate synthase component I family protein [Fodinicola acaciae]|uniref:anthranilate synthase component I family protein n=1 Tax=Fodinicola acaciae TaxID=2681555 RepID=UPI0013D58E95|nr:anthranilate synthase component I family protein [Fodinicola acaciae]
MIRQDATSSSTTTVEVRGTSRSVAFFDPLASFVALREAYGDNEVYLLESLSGPETDRRSSMIGIGRILTLTVTVDQVTLDGAPALVEKVNRAWDGILVDGRLKTRKHLWDLLRAVQGVFDVSALTPEQHAGFGLFGYYGYDTTWAVEDLPMLIEHTGDTPDIVLAIYQGYLLLDLAKRRARIDTYAGDWSPLDIDGVLDKLTGIPLDDGTPRVPKPDKVEQPTTREHYVKGVETSLEHIRAGDIYQLQLGHELRVTTAADPLAVYRRLRARNPSPYMYFVPNGPQTLVGASPELFVRIEDDLITMRPIAGTVRRGRDLAEDEMLAAQMLRDEKEVAEHIMLVDLCRNDIGRVCRTNTLEVPALLTVEAYSHVSHLVSTVTGRQTATADVWDVIAATFPAGTMTGAPKVRAMEIIESLETTRRGQYAGAIGQVSFDGSVNLALNIRSTLYDSGVYHMRASAGVVADSRPDREWAETWQKLGAPYWAITGEEAADAGVRD